jgi:peptide/nickel transport system substrate-binding protein
LTRWKSVALLAALVLWTGCGQGEPAFPGEEGTEFRVLLPTEPQSLDPNSPRDEVALLFAPNLFSRLVALDADSRLLPDLAESWEVERGGIAYTFKLREGVRWHDGEPFTAEDVRWTLERLKSHPSFAVEALRRISAVETPDEHTVVVRLAEPWAPFLSVLSGEGAFILPRHRAAEFDSAGPRRDAIGTGPFKLVEWTPGERIALAANRDFFRPGPYVDRVVYRFVPATANGSDLLLQGAADLLAIRPPLQILPRLSRDPRLKVDTGPTESRYYLVFNLRRPPFGDLRVREALNRALDRPALVRHALQGYGAPGYGFYTPSIAWAYNARAIAPAFDRDRSRSLLDAAGLAPGPRGVRFEPTLVASDLPAPRDLAREVAAQFRAVGVGVRVVLLPHAAWLNRVVGRSDFDLTILGGNHGPDPENLNLRFGSRGASRFQGYASPAFDAAVAEGARTVDLARRARAYGRAQEILARDLPIAPLAETVRITVSRMEVTGLPQMEARGLVPPGDFSLVRVAPPNRKHRKGGGP